MGKLPVRHGEFVFHCDDVADAVAYTTGIKREFNDIGCSEVLTEQAKVLNVVEKFLGSNTGISVVKELLKDAGYDEVATHVAHIHMERPKVARPHVKVAKRLQNAFLFYARLWQQ